MATMLWKGEGREKYVSKNGSFTLDYSRNAGQQPVVLVVQPWRELGFSAPMTTCL